MEMAAAECRRLAEDAARSLNWKRWGPYLSERQWATVREDYSPDGACWDYFPHDQARSRAYRWGEDGLLGITDRECRLCFAPALWNGRDAMLKERLFGLTGAEGNHGEDVKEEYFYLDSTPTHSYLRGCYHYPQAAFPYARLVEENRRRGRQEPEFELADTGVLDGGRYFAVTAEYAKAAPDDLLIRLTVRNCGPAAAVLHLLPTVWFRNTWSWGCRHEGCTLNSRIVRHGDRLLMTHKPSVTFRCASHPRRMAHRRRCCSRRMRPTTNGCARRPTIRPMSRTPSMPVWSTAGRMPSIPESRPFSGEPVASSYSRRITVQAASGHLLP